MAKLYNRPFCLASSLIVPFLSFSGFSVFNLSGVQPCWVVLWLLPWALEDGPISGAIAGLYMGLVLDGLSVGGASYIPSLIILGWFWGRIGRIGPAIEGSLNLGLLSWLGSVFLGLTLWFQFLFSQADAPVSWLYQWGWHSLFAESILTGLLAPIIVSWQLLLWRQKPSSS